MQLPDELIINSLKGFCICHFKDTKHAPEAPPHFYVTVPIDDSSSLLLSIITSQIENKRKYYNKVNQLALQSLVLVDKNDLSVLNRQSVIDCNQAELIRKDELLLRIDHDFKISVPAREISDGLKNKVVEAVKKSPLIKPYIKNLIKHPF